MIITDPDSKVFLFAHALGTKKATTAYAWALMRGDRPASAGIAWGVGCTMVGPGCSQQSNVLACMATGVEQGALAAKFLEVDDIVVSASNQVLDRIFPDPVFPAPTNLPPIYAEAHLAVDIVNGVRGLEPNEEIVEILSDLISRRSPTTAGEFLRFRSHEAVAHPA